MTAASVTLKAWPSAWRPTLLKENAMRKREPLAPLTDALVVLDTMRPERAAIAIRHLREPAEWLLLFMSWPPRASRSV